jgi:hypothetical protein
MTSIVSGTTDDLKKLFNTFKDNWFHTIDSGICDKNFDNEEIIEFIQNWEDKEFIKDWLIEQLNELPDWVKIKDDIIRSRSQDLKEDFEKFKNKYYDVILKHLQVFKSDIYLETKKAKKGIASDNCPFLTLNVASKFKSSKKGGKRRKKKTRRKRGGGKHRKKTRKKRGGNGDDDKKKKKKKKKRKIEESSGSSGSQSTSRPTSRRRTDDTLEKCSLCLENLEMPAMSFCENGHGFHKHCLNRILVMMTENGLNQVCPNCRGEPHEKVRKKIQEIMQHAEHVRQIGSESSGSESSDSEDSIQIFGCNFCEQEVPEDNWGNPPNAWRWINQNNLMCDTCQDQHYFICGHTHRVLRQPGNILDDEFDCGEHVTRNNDLPIEWSTVTDQFQDLSYRCPRHTSSLRMMEHLNEQQQNTDEEYDNYENTMDSIAENIDPNSGGGKRRKKKTRKRRGGNLQEHLNELKNHFDSLIEYHRDLGITDGYESARLEKEIMEVETEIKKIENLIKKGIIKGLDKRAITGKGGKRKKKTRKKRIK